MQLSIITAGLLLVTSTTSHRCSARAPIKLEFGGGQVEARASEEHALVEPLERCMPAKTTIELPDDGDCRGICCDWYVGQVNTAVFSGNGEFMEHKLESKMFRETLLEHPPSNGSSIITRRFLEIKPHPLTAQLKRFVEEELMTCYSKRFQFVRRNKNTILTAKHQVTTCAADSARTASREVRTAQLEKIVREFLGKAAARKDMFRKHIVSSIAFLVVSAQEYAVSGIT